MTEIMIVDHRLHMNQKLVQVPAVVKVAMPPYQAVIYNWVKETGTIRADPEAAIAGKSFRTLNNKCMELRKVFDIFKVSGQTKMNGHGSHS